MLLFQAFELGLLLASFSSLSLSCLELITVQPIQIITSIITSYNNITTNNIVITSYFIVITIGLEVS